MSSNVFLSTYPTICRMLSNSRLDDDIQWALELAASSQAVDELKFAFNERMFLLNDLMLALSSGTILPYPDRIGPELEQNLVTVTKTVGLEKARSAYRRKLLINSKDQFEDVCYEIAVTSKACSLFDAGSVDLEVPIDGTENDSDVRAAYHGVPVRLEVTVLHDSLLAAFDPRLEDIVKAAQLPSGFIVAIRQYITSEPMANRIRSLIEFLHEHHLATSGSNTIIDGLKFEWRRGSYACPDSASPIRSVEFDLSDDIRLIDRPVQTRAVTPQYMIDDFEQPKGVVTLADVPHEPGTHIKNPLSNTIHKKVQEKLKQCEAGVVNLVVLGKPLAMSDNEVYNALYGAEGTYVTYTEDEHGLRHHGPAFVVRDPKAPFVPEHRCPDPIQFIDAFRKVSAVWLLRLSDSYGLSRCLPNPNASLPVPRGLAEAITDASAVRPSPAGEDLPNSDSASVEPDPDLVAMDESDVDIVWTEMADEFVQVCGGLQAARNELAALAQSGRTLAQLQTELDRIVALPLDRSQGMKFISPTNQELAMQFVIGCGGFEQARFCLDEWEKERSPE